VVLQIQFWILHTQQMCHSRRHIHCYALLAVCDRLYMGHSTHCLLLHRTFWPCASQWVTCQGRSWSVGSQYLLASSSTPPMYHRWEQDADAMLQDSIDGIAGHVMLSVVECTRFEGRGCLP
jgi:hypothetical protein